MTAEQFASVTLYSLSGQQLMYAETPVLDVSSLPAGMYVVRVNASGNIVVQKIIKTK